MKRLATALCALVGAAAPAFALDKLTLGTVPTVGDGPLICAIERGYFREVGLEVELVPFQGVIQMMPLIVRGDLKMIGGTLSASYFNSVARGMPLKYFVNRARSPVWHGLIVTQSLADKVKSVKDLKGRAVGVSGSGGFTEYELARWLEGNGMTIDDIQTKTIGMPESVAALNNGSLDSAIFVPPFDAAALRGGGMKLLHVDEQLKLPPEVSGIIYNDEWASKNRDIVDRFTIGHIRGGRCYMEAARRGPNRAEMISYFVKHAVVKDPALYENQNWSELDRNGKMRVESLMDQQEFYIKRGYITERLPKEKIVDEGPVARALAKIGEVPE